ncbi:hypothetical protein WJX77_011093 [Trebouxia sp. C0004]
MQAETSSEDSDADGEQSGSNRQEEVAMIISGDLAGSEDDDDADFSTYSHTSDDSSCSDDDMYSDIDTDIDEMDTQDKGLHDNATAAPLQAAENCQPLSLVQILLSHGADIDLVDNQGNTALAIATQDGHLDVVKALLCQGADFNGKQGQSPLYGAVYHGRLHVVQHLLLHPQAADALLDKEHPVLLLAVARYQDDIVRELMQHGAEVSQANKWSECLAICEFLTNVEAPLDKESLGPLEARVSAQEQVFVRQASQLLQELHNIAGSAQLPAWSQALGSDRDEREKEYKDSVEKLQQLFQSRIDLCSQAPKAEVGHLQSNVAPRGPEQDNQQLTSDSVDSVEEAISQSMAQLGQSEQVLHAFETTAIARAGYEHALASEEDLLQEVTASWQQCIDGSSVLIERSRQRQQLRSVEGNQQQAEAYIRDVKRQKEGIRQMQDLKSHAEQAIATALTLQERHRETTCKLISAKAALQILHLDKKQAECVTVQLDIDALNAELATISNSLAAGTHAMPDAATRQPVM